jgi:hypothetical protein
MSRPQLEVAEVIRRHGPELLERYGGTLNPAQRRVLHDLANCRTSALGGHVELCDRCGHRQIAYNSCRNRHCPKCRATAAAEWLEARAAELLPVPYFHVVFTLPSVLNPLALAFPRVVYDVLLKAAAATLLEVAADPRHLGAKLGVLAVLHTWGQTLQLHPHAHCVVPGGGPSADGSRFVMGRAGFFLPVRVLSRVFRGKVLHALEASLAGGERGARGGAGSEASRVQVRGLLRRASRTEWVVYAKPPFGGPAAVLKYLACYTHRVAIRNHRLLGLEEGQVAFRWKDYAHGSRRRVMRLEAVEFLRRFLRHVLPAGFVRIRHFGWLSNRCRRAGLERCRALLTLPSEAGTAGEAGARWGGFEEPASRVEPMRPRAGTSCPACGVGRMVREMPWGRGVGGDAAGMASTWATASAPDTS